MIPHPSTVLTWVGATNGRLLGVVLPLYAVNLVLHALGQSMLAGVVAFFMGGAIGARLAHILHSEDE